MYGSCSSTQPLHDVFPKTEIVMNPAENYFFRQVCSLKTRNTMKSIPVLSSDWMNVVDAERNQIVFQNRNQAFGAFKIRREYNQTLLLALLIASSLFIAIPSSFILLSNNEQEMVPAQKILDGEIFITKILPVEPLKPAEPLKAVEPPVSTRENIVPVVQNEPLPVKTDEQEKKTPETPENKGNAETGGANINSAVGNPNGLGSGSETTIPIIDVVPDNTVHRAVQTMPVFPGGEAELFRFLKKNILYPKDDKLIGNQGTVFVYFVIDKNGFPTGIKIVNPQKGKENLEKEAMRVIGKMPQWSPGIQDGKPALVSFTLPIRFVTQ